MFKKLLEFMKRRKIITALIICVLIGIGGMAFLYFSHNSVAQKIKSIIKDKIAYNQLSAHVDETKGFSKIKDKIIYQNNKVITEDKIDLNQDVKKVFNNDNNQRLINYPDGYLVDIPLGFKWDFSYGKIYVKAVSNDTDIEITKEYSPYEDVDGYISYYFNRFIENTDYQKANKITMLDDETKKYGNNEVKIIKVKYENLDSSKEPFYSYYTIKTNNQNFYRIFIKSKTELQSSVQDEILNSFSYFKPQGTAVYDLDLHPVQPQNWTDETKAMYSKISNNKSPEWGIFAKNIYTDGINKTVPEMEKKIGYKFDVILSYLQYGDSFPVDFMQKNYDQGHLVELTYQTTSSNNNDLFGYTPNLDFYRGLKDDDIRAFAKKAKEFGHPFLFRLDNEMNSDWTSYSGVINLSDPQIYIDNWRRIYNIFKEEGVNNAIWIFNPNDRNCPPNNWNDFMAYYPGNDYVQMIGVTGYNNGTYYAKERSEEWREFKTIYDDIQNKYKPVFDKFPWIITEFASSSIGGDKAKWISNMFDNLGNYPEIKIAVWFSYADYDYRPGKENVVSRPYWLDETPQTLDAFKKGLEKQKAQNTK